jgi:hypothetical protein
MASLNSQTLIREGESYFLTNVGTVRTPYILNGSGASLTISPSNGVSTFVWSAALGQSNTIRQDASGVTVFDETTPVLTSVSGNTIMVQGMTVQLFGNPQGFMTLSTSSVRTLLTQSISGATIALTSDGKINTSNLQVGTTSNAAVVLGPATNTNRAIAGPSRFAFGDGGIWQVGSTLNIDSSKSIADHAIQLVTDGVNIATDLNTQAINATGSGIGIRASGDLISTLGTKRAIISGSGPSGTPSIYAYDTATSTYADLTIQGYNGASISKSAINSPTNIFLTSQGAGKKVILNGAIKVLQPKRFWAYITSGDQLIYNATSVAAADSATFAFSSAIRVDPTYPNVLSTPGGILKSQFEPPVNGVYEFTLTLNIQSPAPPTAEYMLCWGANMAVYKTNYTPGQPSVSTYISHVLPMQTFTNDTPVPFQTVSQVSSYNTITWTFVYPMIATSTSYDTLRFIPTFVASPSPSISTSIFSTRIGAGTTLAIRLL